ncbi:MAG: nucleotide exchange factor GrpE [Rikenellaceae bacterium]
MTTQEIKDQEVNNQKKNVNPAEEAQATDTMAEEQAADEPATDTMAEATAEEQIWRDKFLRLQAEFDNYRKRTIKEKMDLVQSGGADVLKAILPVLDDMQRAVAAMEKSEDIVAVREGVNLISQKFQETMRQRGVVEIEAIGKELDTDLHEAVARFAAGEDKSGKIIDVVQSGYMLGDKVLRFAKVVVGE